MNGTRRDWASVDWSKRTSDIARELGCGVPQVSRARRKHAPATVAIRPGRPASAEPAPALPPAPSPVIAESLPPAEAAPRPPASPAARAALAAAIEHHPELGTALLEHLDPPLVSPIKHRVRRTPGSDGRSSHLS